METFSTSMMNILNQAKSAQSRPGSGTVNSQLLQLQPFLKMNPTDTVQARSAMIRVIASGIENTAGSIRLIRRGKAL